MACSRTPQLGSLCSSPAVQRAGCLEESKFSHRAQGRTPQQRAECRSHARAQPSPSICPESGKERDRLPPRPETEAAHSRKPAHFPCKLLSQLFMAIIPDMCGNWRPLQGSFHPCCQELPGLSGALLWATNHNTTHVMGTSKMVWWFKKQVRRNEGGSNGCV